MAEKAEKGAATRSIEAMAEVICGPAFFGTLTFSFQNGTLARAERHATYTAEEIEQLFGPRTAMT